MEVKDFDLQMETPFLEGCGYRLLGWSSFCLDILKAILHCLLASSLEVKEFLDTLCKPLYVYRMDKQQGLTV